MNKKNSFRTLLGISLGIAVLILGAVKSSTLAAPPPPYKTICHHTPGNDVTIEFQNEQSYTGHLGEPHSAQTYDTDGPCGASQTPISSGSPSPTEPSGGGASPIPTTDSDKLGGPPTSEGVSPSGQTLGTSVLGVTGSTEENLISFAFILGAISLGLGTMKHASQKAKEKISKSLQTAQSSR